MGYAIELATNESVDSSELGDVTTDGGNLHHCDDTWYVVKSKEKGTGPADRGILGGARGV